MQLKNIAKFELTPETTIPLETRVAHQIGGIIDKNGKMKNMIKIDFEFTAECLTDFHTNKNTKNFLNQISKPISEHSRNESNFKDLSLYESVQNMAPKTFIADNLNYVGPIYKQPQDKVNEEVFKKVVFDKNQLNLKK